MPQPPLASVCVPVYNKRDYLARTLEAILGQTYPALEVVVSDNGSDDGSTQIGQDFARRDQRVRFFRLEHTVSINESWRYALRLGRGEFLKLHSADDTTLAADFLQRMIQPMLEQSELDYTACELKPLLEYPAMPDLNARLASTFASLAQVCREVIALPTREQRARKIWERASFQNLLGTPFALVMRRRCLPSSHWSKAQSPLTWPESYPDWDTAVRVLLHHRGLFMRDVVVHQHFDAGNAVFRAAVDNEYDLLDVVAQSLLPFNVLVDPELWPLRQQARPEELAKLMLALQERLPILMEISDQVAAFEHPDLTARLLPRLEETVRTYQGQRDNWLADRRLRQLRLTLAKRWLLASNERTEQEFHGPAGAVHRLLIASGIRSAPLDVREQAVLEQAQTALDQPRAQTDTWGTWLALHLYADPQTFTRSNRALLPIWLRDVVGSH